MKTKQGFLEKAVNWFVKVKAPDMEEKIALVVAKIEAKKPLEERERKLVGFIIFDYQMHQGPLSFLDGEEAAKEFGVIEEVKYYANDWINYSKSSKNSTGDAK